MRLPVSLLIPASVAIMLAGPFSSEIALAKRIPMSYPSLSVGLATGADSGASHVVIEDEHSLATLKADVGKAYGIIETILLPEIRKEFDEKKDIYSNNYVEIIGGYYDVKESKLDVVVSKIPPDYGCDSEGCVHRTVIVDLPVELELSHIQQLSFGIAVHQNMGPSDDSAEYDMFVDRVLKKASDEARVLSSEAAGVLKDHKERLLEDEIAVEYLLLRQYNDISRVSVLFGSLDPDTSCTFYCKKPLDVVITSNSNYERLWAKESSLGTGQHEQPTHEMLQECRELGIEETECSDIVLLQRIPHQPAIDRAAIEQRDSMITNSFALIGIGAAGAGTAAIVVMRKLR